MHPAKLEVRFRERIGVERAVEEAVRDALGRVMAAASMGGSGGRARRWAWLTAASAGARCRVSRFALPRPIQPGGPTRPRKASPRRSSRSSTPTSCTSRPTASSSWTSIRPTSGSSTRRRWRSLRAADAAVAAAAPAAYAGAHRRGAGRGRASPDEAPARSASRWSRSAAGPSRSTRCLHRIRGSTRARVSARWSPTSRAAGSAAGPTGWNASPPPTPAAPR